MCICGSHRPSSYTHIFGATVMMFDMSLLKVSRWTNCWLHCNTYTTEATWGHRDLEVWCENELHCKRRIRVDLASIRDPLSHTVMISFRSLKWHQIGLNATSTSSMPISHPTTCFWPPQGPEWSDKFVYCWVALDFVFKTHQPWLILVIQTLLPTPSFLPLLILKIQPFPSNHFLICGILHLRCS